MKRRTYRKRPSKPWYKKKYSALEMAGKALTGVNYIRGLINVEKHYKTTSETAATINYGTGNNVKDLTAIAQGDEYYNRNGNSLLAKSVFVRGYCRANDTSGQNVVRIMIVKDKMNQSGTPPTYGDMFSGAGTANAPLGSLRKDNGANVRFQILWSRMIMLNSNGRDMVPWKKYINLGNTHIKYTGSSDSDQYKNQIYLVHVSDVNVNDPTMDFVAEVAYYDN